MQQPVLKINDHRSSRHADVTIRKPVKLGAYSNTKGSDGDVYREDEGQLRVLKLPAQIKHVNYDLSNGYIRLRDGGSIICNQMEKEPGLKNILKWVLSNKDKFQLQSGIKSNSALNTDFLTFRGIIVKIMTTPYENREGWCIAATKYKGTIYLYEYMTEKKIQDELNRDERSNMFSYGGFRFEYYITKPADPDADDRDIDFQHHSEYCCIARTRLGNHSLAYGAEMDCVDSFRKVKDPALSDFVEIKTTRTVDNQRQWDNMVRNKMFKWWAQCYMIGIPTLVCGYRDDNMTVREIELLNVSDMPKMAKKVWSPEVCLRFLNRFLDFAKSMIQEDDPNVMYEFHYEPGRDVTCVKTAPTPDRFVIPQWYIDAL
jgi:RAT1-interacting protein